MFSYTFPIFSNVYTFACTSFITFVLLMPAIKVSTLFTSKRLKIHFAIAVTFTLPFVFKTGEAVCVFAVSFYHI